VRLDYAGGWNLSGHSRKAGAPDALVRKRRLFGRRRLAICPAAGIPRQRKRTFTPAVGGVVYAGRCVREWEASFADPAPLLLAPYLAGALARCWTWIFLPGKPVGRAHGSLVCAERVCRRHRRRIILRLSTLTITR